jgi:arylsulfatase A-like enzyme
VRVPLLVRLPGRVEADAVLAGPVELIDLGPTMVDLAGASWPGSIQGRSLSAALAGQAALDPQRPVYLHRRHYEPGTVGETPVSGEKFGIRIGPWKYIEGTAEGTRELFNLQDDPGERVNLYDPARPELGELARRLEQWKADLGGDAFAPPRLTQEDDQRLRALGYVQ